MKRKEKRNLAIRVFLAAQKGEKCTARQIADFLNENKIVDKYGFGGREMGLILSRQWRSMKGVDRVKKGNRYYYYWSEV